MTIREDLAKVYGREPPSFDVELVEEQPSLLSVLERLSSDLDWRQCSVLLRQWPRFKRFSEKDKESLVHIVLQGPGWTTGGVSEAAVWLSDSEEDLEGILGEAKSLKELGSEYLLALPSVLPRIGPNDRRRLAELIRRPLRRVKKFYDRNKRSEVSREILCTSEWILEDIPYDMFHKATSYILRKESNPPYQKLLIENMPKLLQEISYKDFQYIVRTLGEAKLPLLMGESGFPVLLEKSTHLIEMSGKKGFAHAVTLAKRCSSGKRTETAQEIYEAVEKLSQRHHPRIVSGVLGEFKKNHIDTHFLSEVPRVLENSTLSDLGDLIECFGNHHMKRFHPYEFAIAAQLQREIGKDGLMKIMSRPHSFLRTGKFISTIRKARLLHGQEYAARVANVLEEYHTVDDSCAFLDKHIADKELLDRMEAAWAPPHYSFFSRVQETIPSESLHLPIAKTMLALGVKEKWEIHNTLDRIGELYNRAAVFDDPDASVAILLDSVRNLKNHNVHAAIYTFRALPSLCETEGTDRTARHIATLRNLSEHAPGGVRGVCASLPEILDEQVPLDELVWLTQKSPSHEEFAKSLPARLESLRSKGGEALTSSTLNLYMEMAVRRRKEAPLLLDIVPALHEYNPDSSIVAGITIVESAKKSASLTKALMSYSIRNTAWLESVEEGRSTEAWHHVYGLMQQDWRIAGAFWEEVTLYDNPIEEFNPKNLVRKRWQRENVPYRLPAILFKPKEGPIEIVVTGRQAS